ncbi:Gcd10p-domain-containing protein [Calocera viscosa TUFC12733]|uniref:tRNA (adenine(58)-N(1))-methyltransferase non-catalytic subunit TRM6 n=1 Tax=Calocera viscosa (strain TUFC12733) TaxID=1330018 RepID=A0A167JW84_CALVF|nr:Gcd10p-domain-containing protein [Calocera viscosa TUFC12733]
MAMDSHLIKLGDHVVFKMPSEQTRVYKLEENTTVNLGKFGSFPGAKLLGHPFGLTYTNERGELRVMQPEVVKELEETQATNEYIEDVGDAVQPLTYEEIEALKKSGADAAEIISRQINSHANYELKTEFSKEKYKKRKQAKFSKTFTALPPSLPNLLDHFTAQGPARVQHLRIDTLAQLLTFANIQEGGRYIVVEDCGGLVVGAMLERMGGTGRLLEVHDADSPPAHHVLGMMNLSQEEMSPLRVLNWATAEETHTPIFPPTEVSGKKIKSERERRRIEKRKEAVDQVLDSRRELFEGDWDAMIVASQYEPFSIVERLGKYLGGSANCVLHSPYSSVLADVQYKLRQQGGWLHLQLTEGWLRRYQVLPGRTHPDMNVQGSGGWLLHAIKVYDDPSASSVVHWEVQARKKRKLDAVASDATTPAEGETEEVAMEPAVVGEATEDAGGAAQVEDMLLDPVPEDLNVDGNAALGEALPIQGAEPNGIDPAESRS